MSDTPKTDAFEALVNRPMNWWDFARELERENAALREDYRKLAKVISRTERSHAREVSFTKLQLGVAKSENAALREQVEELDAKWKMAEDQCFDQVGKIGELERENAERGLRLVTIEEIIDDSHRSDKAKVLALKWMLGRKEAQP